MNVNSNNFMSNIDINMNKNELMNINNSSTQDGFINLINELQLGNELKLGLENNGLISSNKYDDNQELILYNLIYALYNNLNPQENFEDLNQSKNLDFILGNKINIDLNEDRLLNLDGKLLNLNDINELKNYIKSSIDEDRDSLNNNIESIVEKIKEYIKNSDKLSNDDNMYRNLDKLSNDDNMYRNLDNIGMLNMSKIDGYSNAKSSNNDIDYLENIISDNRNNTNFLGTINNSSLYINDTSSYLDKPVNEIRADFVSDDIVKAVKYIKSNHLEELNIKFNPQELGEISIKLSKNDEDVNLLITIDDDMTFDMVNKNIDDIKRHLNDINMKVNNVLITVKVENEDLFSGNFSQEFNKERNSEQNKNNKYKNNKSSTIDEVDDYNSTEENLNILI